MKTKLSIIYKIITLICCVIGLYLNFELMGFKHAIIYFTIQSNMLVFLFYLISLILKIANKLEKNNIYYIFKGMVTMAITITMIVFWVIIASKDLGVYKNNLLACNFVHIITPLFVIFDYIIFGEKGNLKSNYPYIWSLTLVAYLAFDLIYVSLGGTFENGSKAPYFFMDMEKLKFIDITIYNLSLYLGFILYGKLIQKIDNKIANK